MTDKLNHRTQQEGAPPPRGSTYQDAQPLSAPKQPATHQLRPTINQTSSTLRRLEQTVEQANVVFTHTSPLPTYPPQPAGDPSSSERSPISHFHHQLPGRARRISRRRSSVGLTGSCKRDVIMQLELEMQNICIPPFPAEPSSSRSLFRDVFQLLENE